MASQLEKNPMKEFLFEIIFYFKGRRDSGVVRKFRNDLPTRVKKLYMEEAISKIGWFRFAVHFFFQKKLTVFRH